MKKLFALFLTSLFVVGSITGCVETPNSSTSDQKENVNGAAIVRIGNSSDKYLQEYDTSVKAGQELKEKFESRLQENIEINAYKNEYESKTILLTANRDIASYNVSFSDLVKGEKKIENDNIKIYHQYYHEIETIYATASEMTPGMYPDALIPFDDAERLGMNKIEAGNNQGVYATIYIPKDTEAGVYTGTATVQVEGQTLKTVPVSVKVYDYTLPDTVTMKSCIPQQIGYFFNGELSDTDEMYQTYTKRLNQYRLSVHYLNSYLMPGSMEDKESIEYILDREIELALEAAKNPSVSAYGIRSYASYSEELGYDVLREDYFKLFLKTYIDGSIEHDVNLLEKAYIYAGNIIDEPDLRGEVAIQQANYVCNQIEAYLEEMAEYARGQGGSEELIATVRKIPNVVTGNYVEGSNLTEVQSYCPEIDKLNTAYQVYRYQSLRDEGKSYWWYTCTQPKAPYPGYQIDDNGVSARLMSWMAKEYQVDGYLTWEDAYYKTTDVNGVTSDCKGMECYDNVHRWSDAYGDGILFYPGRPLGIDGPVDSLRLPIMRDGLEENEALFDLERKYAALGETYGTKLDASGVLNELYASLYGSVKVYCTSDELDEAHDILGRLLELANQGIAISDFKIGQDGKITANVYAPQGKTVKLNGQTLSFMESGSGAVASVSMEYAAFKVECDGYSVNVPLETNLESYAATVDNVKLYDATQNEVNGNLSMETVAGMQGVKLTTTPNSRITLSVTSWNKSMDEGSLVLYVYSEKDVRASISVQGNNKNSLLEEYMLHVGWNELRIDRLQDFSTNALKQAQFIHISLRSDSEIQICRRTFVAIRR